MTANLAYLQHWKMIDPEALITFFVFFSYQDLFMYLFQF
jgi:hypothetical protein